MRSLSLSAAIASALLALLGSSCYHLAGHSEKLALVHVENVHNETQEPLLGSMLHSAINEQLSHGRKAKLKGIFPLELKITGMDNANVARAEIRDKKTRDDDSDAYQTVLYRITMHVQYSLGLPDGKNLSGTVTGIGDLPKMHDRNVPLQHALKLAANDAAKKIIDAIGDAPQMQ